MFGAVRETANVFESLQIVFAPLTPWWDARYLAEGSMALLTTPPAGSPTTQLIAA